jgi:hypothetical protein
MGECYCIKNCSRPDRLKIRALLSEVDFDDGDAVDKFPSHLQLASEWLIMSS